MNSKSTETKTLNGLTPEIVTFLLFSWNDSSLYKNTHLKKLRWRGMIATGLATNLQIWNEIIIKYLAQKLIHRKQK